MFGRDLVLAQRFEYKYLIGEAQAESVRAFASCYLVPDTHVDSTRGRDYSVHSLYLDTPGLHLYSSSVAGAMDRFKLRVRFYDDDPRTPAFLEVKARKNDVVVKRRVPVRKDAVGRILTTFCGTSDDLLDASPEERADLGRFCEVCTKLDAMPKVLVRYRREPYMDPYGGPLRVTLDRQIACMRTTSPELALDGPGWFDLGPQPVVLEIKFTDTFPVWVSQMVRELNLVRARSPKYVRSVDALMALGIGVA